MCLIPCALPSFLNAVVSLLFPLVSPIVEVELKDEARSPSPPQLNGEEEPVTWIPLDVKEKKSELVASAGAKGKKPWFVACSQCGRMFTGRNMIKNRTCHVKYYCGTSPRYPCDICGRLSKRPQDLKKHKIAVHGVA